MVASDSVGPPVRGTMQELEKALKNSTWPHPFPGYSGLFTYEVDEANNPKLQAGLGNGIYLWQLDILPGTVEIEKDKSPPKAGSSESDELHLIKCDMKKLLLELPADASATMRATKRCYVIENWEGRVDLNRKEFCLHCDGETKPLVKTTFDFQDKNLPLKRPILAGDYQMQLDDDNSTVKAVHSSWVNFAGLKADQATGYMLRINQGSIVAPMIRPSEANDLEEKLREVFRYLKEYTRYCRDVEYDAILVQVSGINTVDETFHAKVDMEMHYMVSREDVVRFVVDPVSWTPSDDVVPEVPKCINPVSSDSVQYQKSKPSLTIRDGSVWAVEKITYSGTFREILELNNYPFDIQWLHVKFELPQKKINDVMRHRPFIKGDRLETLQQKWLNGGYDLLDADIAHDSAEDKPGKRGQVFVGCKVGRKAFGICMRTMFVMFLVIVASLCCFFIDPVGGLSDRLGLIFTMMLTAAAYAVVVSGMLPPLGYLTLLDMYILLSFAFFVLQSMQVCIVGMLGATLESAYVNGFVEPLQEFMSTWDYKDVDHQSVTIDVVCIAIAHILGTVYVVFFAIPAETRKGIDDPKDDGDDSRQPVTSGMDCSCIPRLIPSDDEDTVLSRPLMDAASLCCNTGNGNAAHSRHSQSELANGTLSPHFTSDSRTVHLANNRIIQLENSYEDLRI